MHLRCTSLPLHITTTPLHSIACSRQFYVWLHSMRISYEICQYTSTHGRPFTTNVCTPKYIYVRNNLCDLFCVPAIRSVYAFVSLIYIYSVAPVFIVVFVCVFHCAMCARHRQRCREIIYYRSHKCRLSHINIYIFASVARTLSHTASHPQHSVWHFSSFFAPY